MCLAVLAALSWQPSAEAQPNPNASITITSDIALGDSSSNYNLGFAVVTGDFDDDGWDDLAIGAAGWRNAGNVAGGAVAVLYGGAGDFALGGLDASRLQLWNQNSSGVADVMEDGDAFGDALAVGDFDDDGYDDLAIGVPFEDFELCVGMACAVTENHGGAHVLYGSGLGLTGDGSQFFQQGVNLPGELEEDEWLGSSLAAGDFDLDGNYDLAIGVPRESLETPTTIEVGAINVIYGSETGLDTGRTLFWHQNTAGIEDVATSSDKWGQVLTTGNFRGLLDPGVPIDLVVGSPTDDQGPGSTFFRAGSVQILQGSALGLLTTDDIYYNLDNPLIPGANESDADFGSAVAVGDFDDDGYDDLAIGAAGKDGGGVEDSGLVYIISSAGAGGLDLSAGVEVWGQDTAGVLETAEIDDRFGEMLLAADLDEDGVHDLVVGVPWEQLAGTMDHGVVQVLYGGSTGLTADGNQLFDQESVGATPESVVGNDGFGLGLAAGRFSPYGPSLVVSTPLRELHQTPFFYFDTGVVSVLGAPGVVFADGFESGDTSSWSTTSP